MGTFYTNSSISAPEFLAYDSDLRMGTFYTNSSISAPEFLIVPFLEWVRSTYIGSRVSCRSDLRVGVFYAHFSISPPEFLIVLI